MLLFGAVVVTSCLEQLVVIQVQRDYAWAYLQSFSVFLARDYLLGPGGFGFVQTAARLLQGLALFVCVLTMCRADVSLVPRLTRAFVGGAVGAALLSVAYVAIDVLGTEDWMAALPEALDARRTVHIGDVNAAGSYFVLAATISLGAAAWSRWRIAWLAASATSFTALWLTSSRAAILAGLIVVVTAVVWSAAAICASDARPATGCVRVARDDPGRRAGAQ